MCLFSFSFSFFFPLSLSLSVSFFFCFDLSFLGLQFRTFFLSLSLSSHSLASSPPRSGAQDSKAQLVDLLDKIKNTKSEQGKVREDARRDLKGNRRGIFFVHLFIIIIGIARFFCSLFSCSLSFSLCCSLSLSFSFDLVHFSDTLNFFPPHSHHISPIIRAFLLITPSSRPSPDASLECAPDAEQAKSGRQPQAIWRLLPGKKARRSKGKRITI